MCGGNLEIKDGDLTCTCEYCGTKQTLPKLTSEIKANLYDRANHFRRNNDFDKAMSIYEKILNEDKTDAEAYWSLVLCLYGIEYVKDPQTGKMIPTINRTQYTSIYSDENYKSAIHYADSMQKSIYKEEAKTIDSIQKNILEISKKEEPFDIFICYKETDDSGRRTPDSVLANDLYHQLTIEGYKVFFSRITLEDKLGTAYEPYIFAALNSSKVMVVIGTKPEYFNAVWVKNEWSRYLTLIKNGEDKTLIPAYRDMDPYDLPEDFSHLQALDMSKLGFMQDLIRGIKKIVTQNTIPQNEKVINSNTDLQQQLEMLQQQLKQQQLQSNSNITALLQRGNMALEDKDWKKSDDFFEEVLNQDAQCAEAYLGKLLAKNTSTTFDEYIDSIINKYDKPETKMIEVCKPNQNHIEKIANEYYIPSYYEKKDIIAEYYKFDRTIEIIDINSILKNKDDAINHIKQDSLFKRTQQYANNKTLEIINSGLAKINEHYEQNRETAEKHNKNEIFNLTDKYNKHIKATDEIIKKNKVKAIELMEQNYQRAIEMFNIANSLWDYNSVKTEFMNLAEYKNATEFIQKCNDYIEMYKKNQVYYDLEKVIAFEKSKRKQDTVVIAIFIVVPIILILVIIIINNF
jgi:tetratricopeptide (TPR) repeat protein